MSALVKYTLARLGLFTVVAAGALLVPFPINLYLRLGVALLVSAALAYVLLRPLRDAAAEQLAEAARQRAQRRQRLQEALSGDDPPAGADGKPEDVAAPPTPPTQPDAAPATQPDTAPATQPDTAPAGAGDSPGSSG